MVAKKVTFQLVNRKGVKASFYHALNGSVRTDRLVRLQFIGPKHFVAVLARFDRTVALMNGDHLAGHSP